ncbi:MAG TPA: T9SS type A sorting domain-containing protein [Bacteroidia bacterium]|nr:T9SS type A sorting domain-containing protein [Bacteroidia bacterium]HRH62056.1 T9SS type A sorting domain-containing protein [Bacteroidia bacterium]
MKKIAFIFAFFLLAFTNLSAQVVTIGNGVSNLLYGPIYIFSSGSTNTHSWNLSIYQQSELVANGATPGLFTSAGWYKNDLGAYLSNDASFEIYMKPTTLSNFSGGAGNFDIESVGATLVYSSTAVGLPASIGWVDFTFSTPFIWNGTDNVMVLTRWVRTGAGTAAVNWAATSGFNPAVVSHSFSATTTMGSLYTTGSRANIHFSVTPVGINKLETDTKFLVYPNPAKDKINLKFDETYPAKSLSICDALGAVVYTETIKSGQTEILLNNLDAGIYFLKIEMPDAILSKKLVIVNE